MWCGLKKQPGEKVGKNIAAVQEVWFDADAHDEWITDMWNKTDDNSVQEQHQWKEL